MNIGINITIPGKGSHVVKAKLICAVMDLPAKAAILNCMQYNGAYGCSTCKHPGSVVSIMHLQTKITLIKWYVCR